MNYNKSYHQERNCVNKRETKNGARCDRVGRFTETHQNSSKLIETHRNSPEPTLI